jgi:alpha/beta superfamily hydrolase
MTDFASLKSIPGPAGNLEVACAVPTDSANVGFAIICHPHPLFGGAMGNKVVTTLERFFRERGLATLRFNFRGVGASEGVFDDGIGESDDLRAVTKFASHYFPDAPLWLAGFSFGSYVAARVATELGAVQLLSIAPPVGKWDFAANDAPLMPWTIVQGELDEIVEPHAVYDFVASALPTPTLIRIPDATHFFHGKLLELRTALTEHFSQ